MSDYICKIATLEDIIKKHDYEIEKAVDDKNNWIIWKEKAIEKFNKGLSITYMLLHSKNINKKQEIIYFYTATHPIFMGFLKIIRSKL